MNQAIKLSEVENGPLLQWDKLTQGYVTDEDGNPDYSKPIATAWFNKYLKPYFRSVKVEETAKNVSGYIKLYFSDGSMAIFSANSVIFYPESKNYKEMEYAVNPDLMRNDPEYSGTQYFTFFFSPWDNNARNQYHYQRGIEPYAWNWNGTKEMLLNDNGIGCKADITNERAYCTKLIQLNGWKIPKDYPLKF